ncbi:PDDEXK nuclease domain-containing protein [Clostridium fessum]
MLERDIEQALVRDVKKLLLELGTGFAFLGNQYHLNVGGDDFYERKGRNNIYKSRK